MIELENISTFEENDDGDFSAAPTFVTLRVNCAKSASTSFTTMAESIFHQDFKVERHPIIDDVVVITGKDNRVNVISAPNYPIAIVSAECGNAVLRGANVFSPGVIALQSQAVMNAEVSVFADKLNSVPK